jgi:beta-1,4-mannosyltransferase
MLSSTTKHVLHCLLLASIMIFFLISSGAVKLNEDDFITIDPWVEYGTLFTVFLYTLRFLTFFTLPQMMCNFLGLLVYNVFPDKPVLKGSPLLAPFICIRVVTRGDYPDLVKNNVMRNMNTCIDTGLENFLIEVVTDKPVNIQKHRRIREVVVAKDYKTKTGAMFKSRALQYCLEDSVNVLNPNDWIVHLDEETILTENAVRGITNFVSDGKYPFGQGLITYANENVVNWLTTLADSFRVSDDMGKLRFTFKTFHKPIFSWKGSYVVTQVRK